MSLRAPPFHGYATCLVIRNTNQFWPSPRVKRIGVAVETPQRILVGRTIFLLRKVYFGLTDTKPRRSKRIDQAMAGDPVQGRNVPPDTGGHEVLVSLATNGNLNKALAKGLKQLLVSSILAVITGWRAAGNQKCGQGDRHGIHQGRAMRTHPPMMPPLARICVSIGCVATLSIRTAVNCRIAPERAPPRSLPCRHSPTAVRRGSSLNRD